MTVGSILRTPPPVAVPAGATPVVGTLAAARGSARILLIEPQFVMRRTVVAVAADVGIGAIREAPSIDAAQPVLAREVFDGLVIDIGTGDRSLELLRRLRAGGFASPAGIAVIGLVTGASSAGDEAASTGRLAPFGLLRTVKRPFKVAELLQAMQLIQPGLPGTGSGAEAGRSDIARSPNP